LLGHREQLPKCLRDFLRPYFGNMQLGNWNPISPVDDARFISGLPVYVPSDKVAITLGLYDIHYNATKVSLTSRDSIGVIAEEIAHTVQFIKIWEKVEADHGINYSYQKAQAAWGIAYFGNSAKIGAKNLVKGIVEQVLPSGIVLPKEDEYRDNNYEKEAIAIRGKVEESLKLLDRGPCD